MKTLKGNRAGGFRRSALRVNNSTDGDTLERKIAKRLKNGEKIEGGGSPEIFTDKKAGVAPETDMRTDRFEIALDGMDAIQKSRTAKAKMSVVKDDEKKGIDASKEGKGNADASAES